MSNDDHLATLTKWNAHAQNWINWVFNTITLPTCATASAEDNEIVLYSPDLFDGAFVKVYDNAKNGCSTNIGEVKTHAEDQMDLAGFSIVDYDNSMNGPAMIFDNKYAALLFTLKHIFWKPAFALVWLRHSLLRPLHHRVIRWSK